MARVEITQPLFQLTCDTDDWLPQYLEYHSQKLADGIGFFHLHEWLKERGVPSIHRVVWDGWGNLGLWLAAWALLWLFPFSKRAGDTDGFYGLTRR